MLGSSAVPGLDNDMSSVHQQSQLSRKKNQFIFDKQLRIKSFVRRRGIPFRRCNELDIQCGTQSFHLQISKDLDEVVYFGSQSLTGLFLGSEGIKVSDIQQILVSAKKNSRGRSDSNDDPDQLLDDDEEYFVKSKSKKDGHKAVRMELITSSVERRKRFKSLRDGLMSKVSELESVSGVVSILIIINTDQDLFTYTGDQTLVTQLFTTGLRRNNFPITYNVRVFDLEEVSHPYL